MANQKLRIGIVGGGGIVRSHLPQLTKRSDAVEVVAIADVNAKAAKNTALEFGIGRHSTDFREWLDDVDAVVVGVPTHLHHAIGIECANAGKHVFIEKPMTRTREQADELLNAVEKNDVRMQVGFVRRFDEEWMTWRELIQQDKLGRPVSWRHVMGGYGAPAPWFHQDEQGGGPFIDGCIHDIDFALYTFGPAEWVFANLRTMRKGNTALDTGTATVRFQSGDELMLAWSWGLPKGSSAGVVFDCLGPRGTMMLGSKKGGEWNKHDFVLDYGAEKEVVANPENALAAAFNKQMDEFIAVARGEDTPRAGAREGLQALNLALAIVQSGRTGEVVRLND